WRARPRRCLLTPSACMRWLRPRRGWDAPRLRARSPRSCWRLRADEGPRTNEGGARMSRPWEARRLHFVGVGGAGMSGYARAAHALGAEVTGSDGALSPYAERLRADGVLEVKVGHDAANVPADSDVELIYSSAVPAENPERVAARERGLRERPRAELLAEFTALK